MSAAALTLPAFLALAAQCAPAVPAEKLAAHARAGSDLSPAALHVNGPGGGPQRASSMDEAAVLAARLVAAGRSVDLGLMRVNSRHLARFHLTVADAMEPCRNIAVGAFILADAERAAAVGRGALGLADFLALAPRCAPQVHPDTLASVVQAESRFRPYPVGVNHAGRSVSSRGYPTKEEAVAAVEVLLSKGITNLDLGPAQISWKAGHLQRRGLAPADAFEPCTALGIAADVLVDCWGRAPAREEQARLDETFACYNSGGFARPAYVQNVRAGAAQVVPALRLAGAPASPAAPQAQPASSAGRACGPPPFDFAERAAFLRACRTPPEVSEALPAGALSLVPRSTTEADNTMDGSYSGGGG